MYAVPLQYAAESAPLGDTQAPYVVHDQGVEAQVHS